MAKNVITVVQCLLGTVAKDNYNAKNSLSG